jgi:hypothetical protein
MLEYQTIADTGLGYHEARAAIAQTPFAHCQREKIHLEFSAGAKRTFSKRIRSMSNIDHSRPINKLHRKVSR